MSDLHRRVAVIGMAGRLPGAPDLASFWRNLAGGVESVTTFSEEELRAVGIGPDVARDPRYVRVRGVLDGVELFDADFFGYKPREAEAMDPQQRLFLECAWEALEDAGCDPSRYHGHIGVFGGISLGTYLLSYLLPRKELVKELGPHQLRVLNRSDMLCTRVSYKLGLRGPSLTVQTACSTSLVAIHLACQSLLNGESDMALAGAVSVIVPQPNAQLYQEGGIISPDGHCRPFDAQARGTLSGNGLGLVVLKRLDRALADGDAIRAVILGSGLNNDGSDKVGYTAPGIAGQAEVIAEALAMAEVPARSVGFIEAHGTATPIGDPIEVAALTEVFRRETADRGFCALGSVKSNFGHLDAAAGIAGLLKAVLALERGIIPPSLHFERPNPELRLEESPFYVNMQPLEWPAQPTPRRAGVSSFGIGGTNVHVVLEQAPAPAPSSQARRSLLVLSARTGSALAAACSRLASHLERCPDLSLADVAWTLQTGRRAFAHRLALVAESPQEAVPLLAAPGRQARRGVVSPEGAPEVAFLFPGQGAQRPGMTADLHRRAPVFREEMDRCAESLTPLLGCDLRQVLYHDAPDAAEAALQRPSLAQAALFATEYALARQWMAWGVQSAAALGHSVGEYVAACLAGVFSLESALALVAFRGLLMEELPEGAMAAVPLPSEQLARRLGPELSLAAVNEPSRCVVAGPLAAVEALERQLAAERIACRRLRTARAFHSAAVEPVLERFRAAVERARPQPPRLPVFSTVTGDWLRRGEMADPGYWVRHLRQPVRFSDALGALLASPRRVLLEAGPGRTLTAIASRHPARADQPVIASLAEEPGEDEAALLEALGGLWCAGVEIDWAAVHRGERRRRLPLPAYPFERRRYWLDLPQAAAAEAEAEGSAAAPVPVPIHEPGRDRRSEVFAQASSVIARLAGLDPEAMNPEATFLELGFDSLLMMQASHAVQDRFGVEIAFRRFFRDVPSLRALVEQVERSLPPEPAAPAVAAPPTRALDGPPLERLLAQQMRLLEQQMEMLRLLVPGHAAPPAPAPAPQPTAQDGDRFGPWRPVKQTAPPGVLTPRQQEHLTALVERYSMRTRGSKELAQAQRRHLADNRLSAGFRLLWKELVYPIAASRSRGSRLWDVDGHEYVDLVMGYGVNLFGHSPELVTEAVREQLEQGVHIGAQTPLAGEVAELVCRLTGAERAAFCNTGSEAVMAALRIARTVTGRQTVAVFSGSYHGISDGVLARAQRTDGERRAVPVAPGIPPSMVENLLILDYGSPESLEILKRRVGEFAAVLVEPVQSSRPDLQPREFLHELRRLTGRAGTALIFDEMISGFRVHPGGAQAWFGVQADLAAYGKIAGGGLPLGIIAGRSAWLDAVDGGAWQFGDGSHPSANQTFFAGTFCKHPLAMAAARAVLRHLAAAGPGLQEELNRRTAALVERLEAVFTGAEVPLRWLRFGSLFKPSPAPDLRFLPLLYFHLIDRGVHLWEGRSCFLSTAHSDEDLERIEHAFRDSVADMQAGEFLPGRPAPAVAPAAEPATARVLPLTASQERLWTVTQMEEAASRAYNESLILHLRGSLDVDALREAVRRTVARHEALRTTFSADGRSQVIHSSLQVDIPLEDLSATGPAEHERLLAELAAREAGETFDLARGPLLRFRLLRLADGHHALLRTVHHLIADGWSMGIVFKEIVTFYAALRRGAPVQLPEPVRWSDWVECQLALAARPGPQAAAAEAFWQQLFAGGVPVLDLPSDRPRSRVPAFAGARVSATMEGPARDLLARAAAAQGTSFFIYLLAAFQALLFRLSGQGDLVVSISSAGQSRPGGGYLVGYCVNLLPVRVRIAAETRFADHLAALQKTLLDAVEHQDYPFLGRTGTPGQLERDPGRSPLHLAVFNLDRSGSRLAMDDIDVDFVANPPAAAKFEVYLNVTDRGDRLILDWDYSSALFDASTVRRWAGHFARLCEAAAADPGRRVAALPLLSKKEQAQLVAGWNDTRTEVPRASLCQLVESQVDRTPDAVAVAFEGATLTYAELEERANRVAHRLIALGVGPETAVGLCLERSLEMVVGLLAILKAEGAWVPLDPAYPAERLALLVADSGMTVALAQRRFAARLAGMGARVCCLDDAGWESEPAARPSSAAGPDNLAYIIYTSGSTGKPKGAMNTHRAICNRLLWMQRACRLEPGDRVLQKTPFTFDVSVWELFLPLLAGVQLVLARPEGHRDPAYLVDLIALEGVSVLHFVPSMLDAFLEEPTLARCRRSLRLVVASGEALPRALQARFHERLGGVELHNLYGPTEAAVDVTSWVCDPEAPGTVVPIGWPIDNVGIHLLDGEGQPVPVGVAAELYIGGIAPARGYLGRPDLTAAAFVPDPLSQAPGERLYRTGDLARRRPDGAVEFLGRFDHQVKLRGFRIELEEIESALRRHPAVESAAVLLREDAPGDRRLVGYVVPEVRRAWASPDRLSAALQAFLREQLPDYMVPAQLIMLDALPLTSSGKLDRRALPAPRWSAVASDRPRLAPVDDLEEVLAAFWTDVLRRDAGSLGVEEDFFHAGGYSLLAIRLAVQVREVFQVQLTLRDLIAAPTVRGLAAALRAREAAPGQMDKIARVYKRLQQMSSAEVTRALQERERGGSAK